MKLRPEPKKRTSNAEGRERIKREKKCESERENADERGSKLIDSSRNFEVITDSLSCRHIVVAPFGRKNLKRAVNDETLNLQPGQSIMQVVSLRDSNLIELILLVTNEIHYLLLTGGRRAAVAAQEATPGTVQDGDSSRGAAAQKPGQNCSASATAAVGERGQERSLAPIVCIWS
ncbi:LOW QUALITY PROTEIN: hypothetical protein M8C21_025800, partial [Ambrosia artemisiifolia]